MCLNFVSLDGASVDLSSWRFAERSIGIGAYSTSTISSCSVFARRAQDDAVAGLAFISARASGDIQLM